ECAHLAAPAQRAAGTHLSSLGARFRRDDRLLWPDAEVCPGIPDDYAVGRGVHTAAYGLPLHHYPQRILPGAGHGRNPGHLAGAADDWLNGHGSEAAGIGEASSG